MSTENNLLQTKNVEAAEIKKSLRKVVKKEFKSSWDISKVRASVIVTDNGFIVKQPIGIAFWYHNLTFTKI